MRWSDMDAYRHINNSAYLAYLEQARVAMFFLRDDGKFSSGTVIARHEIDYLHPVVYHPQPLLLQLWIERVRGAQFTVRYEVFDGGRLVARAATVCVTFDFELDRPRRLSAEERKILAGFADDERVGLGDDGSLALGDGPAAGVAESTAAALAHPVGQFGPDSATGRISAVGAVGAVNQMSPAGEKSSQHRLATSVELTGESC